MTMLLRSAARTLGPGNYVLSGPLPPATRAPRTASASRKTGTSAGKAKAKTTGTSRAAPARAATTNAGTQTAVATSRVQTGRVAKRFKPALSEAYSKGLCNDGDYRCYRNAALQSIFHAPAVIHFLKQIHPECEYSNTNCIICALQQLADTYWSDDLCDGEANEMCVPEAVSDILHNACLVDLPPMGDLAQDFKDGAQADPHQFLQYLITWIKEMDGGIEAQSCSAMFNLVKESTWHCVDCQQDRTWTTTHFGCEAMFWEMPANTTLEQYIRADLVETIDSQCSTTECNAKFGFESGPTRQRTITHKWTSLPQVMIVRLGRLLYDQVEERTTKDRRRVPYPEQTDFGQFLNNGDEKHVYRLDGVIAHQGETLNVGHYVAATRCPNTVEYGVLNDDNGAEYGDGFDTMEDPVKSFDEEYEAYVLVYSKI